MILNELNHIAREYEYLIKAIGAFLPFLIALFMAYVAYQQWQTNEIKRKQDLFEKRYKFLYKKILDSIAEFRNQMTTYPNIKYENMKLTSDDLCRHLNKYRFLVPACEFKKILLIYNDYNKEILDFHCRPSKEKAQYHSDHIDKLNNYETEFENVLSPYLQIEKVGLSEKYFPIFNKLIKYLLNLLSSDAKGFNIYKNRKLVKNGKQL